MYNDLWKKIIIALMAFIGIQIVLVIIPGFVILLTTPNIINVNTESQWISFWGNYFGGLIGAITSLGVVRLTVYFENKKEDKKNKKKFCEEVISGIIELDILSEEVYVCDEDLAKCLKDETQKDILYRKQVKILNMFLKTKTLLKVKIYSDKYRLKYMEPLTLHLEKLEDIVQKLTIKEYCADNIDDFFKGNVKNVYQELVTECENTEEMLIRFFKDNVE